MNLKVFETLCYQTKIKKPYVHFIIKNIFRYKVNIRYTLHSFSIKDIFYDKLDVCLLFLCDDMQPDQT